MESYILQTNQTEHLSQHSKDGFEVLRSVSDSISVVLHGIVVHKRFAKCNHQIQALVPHQISGTRFRAPFFD